MTGKNYIRVNNSDVIFETFEDEVVLINMGTGNYYSIDGTAADIWGLIENGCALDAIVGYVSRKYRVDNKDIKKDIGEFISEIQNEGLIVVGGSAESGTDPGVVEEPDREPEKSKINYEKPSLKSFSDLQELILLDPIHQVDDSGWPHPREEPPDNN